MADRPASTFPTDAERQAVTRALTVEPVGDVVMVVNRDGTQAMGAALTIDTPGFAQAVLAALAPLVADRERAAAARALREAADDLASVTHGRTSEALSHWPDHDRGIYELAIEEASGKIHERADALEAGEDRG